MTTGLLIVNADDWGASAETTERITDCFAAGGVTSATAMVYMADSARAAARARELALPTGLHLNLTQPFDGADVPEPVRDAQQSVAARFGRLRRRDRVLPGLRLRALVRRCVQDQLDAFRALYGREPTHLDGHNHAHLNPVVLFSLPRHMRIRTAVHEPGIGSPADIARLLRHHAIRAQHGSTDLVFSIAKLHPELGGSGLDARLALARKRSVELITHPGDEAEHRLLMSSAWLARLHGLRLGSFEDL